MPAESWRRSWRSFARRSPGSPLRSGRWHTPCRASMAGIPPRHLTTVRAASAPCGLALPSGRVGKAPPLERRAPVVVAVHAARASPLLSALTNFGDCLRMARNLAPISPPLSTSRLRGCSSCWPSWVARCPLSPTRGNGGASCGASRAGATARAPTLRPGARGEQRRDPRPHRDQPRRDPGPTVLTDLCTAAGRRRCRDRRPVHTSGRWDACAPRLPRSCCRPCR